jgi:hypothetical protein
MPERDIFHNAVKNALVKEGWTITDDPLFLEFGGVDMYVDLRIIFYTGVWASSDSKLSAQAHCLR